MFLNFVKFNLCWERRCYYKYAMTKVLDINTEVSFGQQVLDSVIKVKTPLKTSFIAEKIERCVCIKLRIHCNNEANIN